MAGSAATRVKFAPVEGAAPLFTPVFLDYLVDLHDRFTPRIGELLARRAEALTRAHTRSVLPSNPPTSAATTGDWHVPPVPADLQKPGIEISGPCSITSMFINALNPGPEGERAEGDLDDDEDSGGHRLTTAWPPCSASSITSTPSGSGSTAWPTASCRSSCIVSVGSTWSSPR